MQAVTQELRSSDSGTPVLVKVFGKVDYGECFDAMLSFVENRIDDTADEIWLVEHPSVYTQGTACDSLTLNPSNIPIVKTDRGGQITYHGPGQVVMYPLLKLKRFDLGVKSLVSALEQTVIQFLSKQGVESELREGAPGVYVQNAKVAALGLRIKRGCSYHGLSFNVDMDLAPFRNIHPCGYQGLQVTQLADLVTDQVDQNSVARELIDEFLQLI